LVRENSFSQMCFLTPPMTCVGDGRTRSRACWVKTATTAADFICQSVCC